MRKLLAITFVLLSSGVNASETCSNMHALAEVIMTARQNNVSIVKMHNQIDKILKSSDPVNKLGHALVDDAFSESLWRTSENKKSAVSSFANKVYLSCKESGK